MSGVPGLFDLFEIRVSRGVRPPGRLWVVSTRLFRRGFLKTCQSRAIRLCGQKVAVHRTDRIRHRVTNTPSDVRHHGRMKNWGKKFNLIELRKLPITDHTTRQQLRDGSLIPLTSEVAIPRKIHNSLPHWERARATAFAVGLTCDKAVVSGQAAARLLEIETMDSEERINLQLPGATRPSARNQWPGNVFYRSTHLPESQVEEHHGIRVTSLVRTLFDVTRFHGINNGVVAMDSAIRQHGWITQEELKDRLASYPPFPGVRTVRQATEMTISDAGSAQETIARLILLEAALPQIRTITYQAPIPYDRGRKTHRVDMLINDWLIIEIDGEIKYSGYYGKDATEVIREERIRENILKNEGRHVLRFTAADLKQGADGDCTMLRTIRDTLDNYVEQLTVRALGR